jgi:hypothetical protein
MDPHHFDVDPDADSGFYLMCIRMRIQIFLFDVYPTFHPDANPDPDPSFQLKAQTLEEVLKIGSYSICFGLSAAN